MINIDTVYKTVLYILNKEQRGYITPAEFDKLSNQVQREIFEQYFEELNQQLRVPQTDNEYADRVKNLEEKIDIFKKFATSATTPAVTYVAAAGVVPAHFTLPSDLHRLGTLIYSEKKIQPINRNEYFLVNKSPLTKPTEAYPVYTLEGTGAPSEAPSLAYVYPDSIQSGVDAYYIKAPADPRWGYSVGGLGQYVYEGTPYGANLLNTGGSLTSSIIAPLTTAATTSVTSVAVPSADVTVTPPGGTGATISITVGTSPGPVTAVNIIGAGSGFGVGDVIEVGTALIGGATPLKIELQASDFNANSTYGSTQLELHPSEQTNIILNILMYCGVIIRDPQIVQNAAQMIAQDEANEKS